MEESDDEYLPDGATLVQSGPNGFQPNGTDAAIPDVATVCPAEPDLDSQSRSLRIEQTINEVVAGGVTDQFLNWSLKEKHNLLKAIKMSNLQKTKLNFTDIQQVLPLKTIDEIRQYVKYLQPASLQSDADLRPSDATDERFLQLKKYIAIMKDRLGYTWDHSTLLKDVFRGFSRDVAKPEKILKIQRVMSSKTQVYTVDWSRLYRFISLVLSGQNSADTDLHLSAAESFILLRVLQSITESVKSDVYAQHKEFLRDYVFTAMDYMDNATIDPVTTAENTDKKVKLEADTEELNFAAFNLLSVPNDLMNLL